jgi:hypothetical protein
MVGVEVYLGGVEIYVIYTNQKIAAVGEARICVVGKYISGGCIIFTAAGDDLRILGKIRYWRWWVGRWIPTMCVCVVFGTIS